MHHINTMPELNGINSRRLIDFAVNANLDE